MGFGRFAAGVQFACEPRGHSSRSAFPVAIRSSTVTGDASFSRPSITLRRSVVLVFPGMVAPLLQCYTSLARSVHLHATVGKLGTVVASAMDASPVPRPAIARGGRAAL